MATAADRNRADPTRQWPDAHTRHALLGALRSLCAQDLVPMPNDDPIEVPIVWVGADELPVLYANQFVAQVDRDEVFLTVGQMLPPPILGATEADRRESAKTVQYVPVRPVARLAINPARLQELISVLEITKENLEKHKDVFGDPRDDSPA